MLSKILLALPCLFLISCVTSTRYVKLEVSEGSRPGVKGKVTLGEVADKRVFESDPDLPSTPSLGMQTPKGIDTKIVVGRQRGSHGKAHANILLNGGQNASERVQVMLREGLAQRGYEVASGGVPANAELTKFWAWMNPGMWTLVLEGQMECVIRLSKGRQIVVRGHGENYCQAATQANWQLTYDRMVEDFMKNLDTQLAIGGF